MQRAATTAQLSTAVRADPSLIDLVMGHDHAPAAILALLPMLHARPIQQRRFLAAHGAEQRYGELLIATDACEREGATDRTLWDFLFHQNTTSAPSD